jgi:hypothetical protein
MSNESARLFVPPGHFYSPIVDPEEAKVAIVRARSVAAVPSVECNDDGQVSFFRQIAQAAGDCNFPDDQQASHRYYFKNDQYSYGDAIIYQAILRQLRPSQLIEVGSGYSSAVALDTRERFGVPHHITFIEPYPERLLSLIRPGDVSDVSILKQKVQSADVGLFSKLRRNDILFIDSSHVAKTGSDLCWIVFEVLPRLQAGVVVHFHDCFWPFEYPERWAVAERRSWNEIYLIRALLMFSNAFEMILFNDYFAKKFPEEVLRASPLIARNPGGGLWLRMKSTQ